MGEDIVWSNSSIYLGPLLFNVCHCDLFFIMNGTEFAESPYTSCQNNDNVIRTLENDSVKLFKWFSNNQIKANKDKCHLLLCNKDRATIKIVESGVKKQLMQKVTWSQN